MIPLPSDAARETLFWFSVLLIASNDTDSHVGSLSVDWERFFEWKRIELDDEPGRVSSVGGDAAGTRDWARLLDLAKAK